jgi:hypothetical protein
MRVTFSEPVDLQARDRRKEVLYELWQTQQQLQRLLKDPSLTLEDRQDVQRQLRAIELPTSAEMTAMEQRPFAAQSLVQVSDAPMARRFTPADTTMRVEPLANLSSVSGTSLLPGAQGALAARAQPPQPAPKRPLSDWAVFAGLVVTPLAAFGNLLFAWRKDRRESTPSGRQRSRAARRPWTRRWARLKAILIGEHRK